MLRGHIDAPGHRKLESLTRLFEDVDGVGIADGDEWLVYDCREPLEHRVINPLLEKPKISFATI